MHAAKRHRPRAHLKDRGHGQAGGSYSTYAPAQGKLDFWLKGGRGSLQLGAASDHLSERGALHQSAHLGALEMGKVNAARAFIVQLEVPGTPAYCSRYDTRRLTVRQTRGAQSTWVAAAPAAENN